MTPNTHHRVDPRLVALALGLVAAAACGRDKGLTSSVPVVTPVVPSTPVSMAGHARVSGVLRDGAGAPVAGATIRLAETDATATTDAAGAYDLAVPSDSTLTFVTTASGFATSFRESIVLADGAAATGFDLTILPTADVARMDAMAATDQVATRGLMALRLHSLSPTCAVAGAKVSVWPPLAAKVLYARPSTTGAVDEPDPTLDAVQGGGRVDVWLAGAIPPGNMFRISVEQPGCALAAAAPSVDGLQLTGLRHVDAQAFSEADLFLQ